MLQCMSLTVACIEIARGEQQSPGRERPKGNSELNDGQIHALYPAAARSTAKVRLVPREPALDADASAELRDRLLGGINELASTLSDREPRVSWMIMLRRSLTAMAGAWTSRRRKAVMGGSGVHLIRTVVATCFFRSASS